MKWKLKKRNKRWTATRGLDYLDGQSLHTWEVWIHNIGNLAVGRVQTRRKTAVKLLFRENKSHSITRAYIQYHHKSWPGWEREMKMSLKVAVSLNLNLSSQSCTFCCKKMKQLRAKTIGIFIDSSCGLIREETLLFFFYYAMPAEETKSFYSL